jgi:hypothetical protein
VAETRIELTGWKAIVAGLLLLVWFGGRIYTHIPKVPDEGGEALRTWLVKDYTGRGPRDVARRLADYRAGNPVQPLDLPAVLPDIELTSVSAHGWRDAMVVRTEISVDGGPPPDSQPVRYLFLTTKLEGGWMVLSESDSYRYYRALF